MKRKKIFLIASVVAILGIAFLIPNIPSFAEEPANHTPEPEKVSRVLAKDLVSEHNQVFLHETDALGNRIPNLSIYRMKGLYPYHTEVQTVRVMPKKRRRISLQLTILLRRLW